VKLKYISTLPLPYWNYVDPKNREFMDQEYLD